MAYASEGIQKKAWHCQAGEHKLSELFFHKHSTDIPFRMCFLHSFKRPKKTEDLKHDTSPINVYSLFFLMCMSACLHACVSDDNGGQQVALNPEELELQMFVSPQVGAGN